MADHRVALLGELRKPGVELVWGFLCQGAVLLMRLLMEAVPGSAPGCAARPAVCGRMFRQLRQRATPFGRARRLLVRRGVAARAD
jgi:hypothetical protein